MVAAGDARDILKVDKLDPGYVKCPGGEVLSGVESAVPSCAMRYINDKRYLLRDAAPELG